MIRPLGLALLFLLGAAGAAAQDSTAVRADSIAPPDSAAAPADTVRPVSPSDSLGHLRVAPAGALWRSLLVPGWGQAVVGRKLAAGFFLGWEGVTLGMVLKTRHEKAYLERTNSGRARDKAQQEQDWLVLLAFNHLLAGLEAYVSAHLSDFPRELHVQATPGGVGASATIPFRVR